MLKNRILLPNVSTLWSPIVVSVQYQGHKIINMAYWGHTIIYYTFDNEWNKEKQKARSDNIGKTYFFI